MSTSLNRRDFFTVTSACSLAAMGGGCTSLVGKEESALQTFRASCTMECLHCHLKATVENGKIIRNIHSSHQGTSWIKEVFGEEGPGVWMHPEDASARGIGNGDIVVCFNDRGEHKARAIVTENIRKGVVCLENGWWYNTDGWTTSSVLTNDTIVPIANGTAICTTLVNVRKA